MALENKTIETIKEEKSESLQMLLEKNARKEGLTEEENVRAFQMIANPKYNEKNCWVCKLNEEEPAIYDTSLCQNHALYALATRK